VEILALRGFAPRAAAQHLEERARSADAFRPLLRGRSFRSAKTATQAKPRAAPGLGTPPTLDFAREARIVSFAPYGE